MEDLDVHLDAIATGDAEAFAAWLAGAEFALRESLGRFARSVDTEAVVQETALRIWTLVRRGSGPRRDGRGNSLLRFAITIARNRAIDAARREGRAIAGPPGDDQGGADVADPRWGFTDPLLRDRIRLCLERLRGRPRQALLTFIDVAGEATLAVMSRAAGFRSPAAFRQNLSRARAALRACLRAHGVENW